MCKRTLFAFALPLFFALLLPLASAGHSETFAPAAGETACPAPAPTGLMVTNATPNSISLTWVGPAATGVYYEVNVFDVTWGIAMPSLYTTFEIATVTGLNAGHCYEFKVRASYCSYNAADMGEWSNTVEGCTGVIIIDEVAEFPSPSGNGTPVSDPTTNPSFNFCIERSTSEEPVYNNGVVLYFGCRVPGYAPVEEMFGIGLPSGTEAPLHLNSMTENGNFEYMSVGQLPNPPLPQGTQQVRVLHKASHTQVIVITYTNLNNPNSPYATAAVNAQLLSGCISSMYYYNDVNCSTASLVSNNKPKWQASHQNNRLTGIGPSFDRPIPNPFSQSTFFTYSVPESGPVDIRLYDALGRLVKVVWQQQSQEAGQYGVAVLGEGLTNGLYQLHVQAGGERKIYTLVKQD